MSINKALPSAPSADGTLGVLPSRTGSYQEAYVNPLGADSGFFADEGSGYIVMNTTAGTGITGNAAPTGTDSTKPFLHGFNNGLLTVIPRFGFLRVTTAPSAGATTTDVSLWADTGSGATTWSSGGSLLTTTQNTNTSVTGLGGMVWRMGALVIVAVSARRLWHAQVRSVISVIQDTYFLHFGTPAAALPSAVATSGTTILAGTVVLPPVAIAPKTNFSLSIDGASQSGAGAYELSLFYTER